MTVLYVVVILVLFIAYMLIHDLLEIKKFRKSFDPTLKLSVSKENKRTFLLYSVLAVISTAFLLFVFPVAGVVPIMMVVLIYQSKLIWVGETHIFQKPNCLIIDKMKHPRLEVKGGTKTLTFKYKNEHLSLNLSLMDETELMKRLKK